MVQQIWPSHVLDFIKSRSCFVMDIRNEEAFRKGHLPKAVHIEEAQIEAGDFSFSKEIPIIVYCSEGAESIRVARLLSMKGYYVYNLAGGYEAFLKYRNKTE